MGIGIQQASHIRHISRVPGVGPASIKWTGNQTVTFISKNSQTTTPIANKGTVNVDATLFGRPGNVAFDLGVYAPEVTNVWWDKPAAIKALRLRVESPMIPKGSKVDLTYNGQSGINGNDLNVRVRMSEMLAGGKALPAGVYPLHFMAGNRRLSTVMVNFIVPK